MSTKYGAVSLGGVRLTGRNESGEKTKRDDITVDVKNWIMIPILFFHVAGFVLLLGLALFFISNEDKTPQYFWPALVVGVAGLPFAFASNVKKLVDSVATG